MNLGITEVAVHLYYGKYYEKDMLVTFRLFYYYCQEKDAFGTAINQMSQHQI